MTVSTKGSAKSKPLHVAHYCITHLITEAPQAKKSTLLLRIADLPLENRIPESFRIGIVQVSHVLVSQICP